MAEVCGQYLLAAAKEARKVCPYTTQINETSAFLWKRMTEWVTFDDLIMEVLEEYEVKDPDEAAEAVRSFLEDMIRLGYLLTDEVRDE